ncbi:hypothetical protein [Streptomyces sp. 3N207]|uniref:hypothetical protein n=1 Tax=Streptomyces sp. 3N207 TaxID=3457417 RepID=UPI003FD355F3
MSSAFHEALGVFASFPRLVVEGYLRRHGFEVREDDQNAMHARCERYTVSIRFDDQDRVIALSHGEDRD